MGDYAEVTFPRAGLIRLAPQCRAEEPLVPREGALRLPALAVHPLVPAAARLLAEPPDHLPPMRLLSLLRLMIFPRKTAGGREARCGRRWSGVSANWRGSCASCERS